MAENPTPRAAATPARSSQPWLHQHGKEIQTFGTVRQFPIALAYETRMYACQRLNQLLADTQILYALYKKHHWLMRGATFYQLQQFPVKSLRQICWTNGTLERCPCHYL